MSYTKPIWPVLLVCLTVTTLFASGPKTIPQNKLLPPAPPWSGQSATLAVKPDHPWATDFERLGQNHSPTYSDTAAWLEKLVHEAPELKMHSIGTSQEKREILMVIASSEGLFSAKAIKNSDKPTVLFQAGIHSGEIDGKDAGMMLLRDLTVRGTLQPLLQKVNILFIPILNVDGHERRSQYNRINQRGPEEMGWRTNGRNLNLNRDFSKAETPGIQAFLEVVRDFDPDLYLDIHVTDGIDYQYDITWGSNGVHGASPEIAKWLGAVYRPFVDKALIEMGHIPGPLIFATDNNDLSKGIADWTASPRYSNGYGDFRHLPTILVENHSLKPYHQRVLGTRVMLEATLRCLAEHGAKLKKAVASDRAARPEKLTLAWLPDTDNPPIKPFLGIQHTKKQSALSGGEWLQWHGKPETMNIPVIPFTKPGLTVDMPKGYWVPAAWSEVIEKLALHDIQFEVAHELVEVDAIMYRIKNPVLGPAPFEGRMPVKAEFERLPRKVTMQVGSVYVPLDQPLGKLAAALLEPGAPDSFFSWGYFLEVLQRTEYFEAYVGEPMAAEMLADADTKKAFDEWRKNHPDASSRDILDWFFKQTGYMDDRWMWYPVALETK
ncbi:M14 family metallopeptidase [Acanthopleuribacter pedis]|uniref:Peptidase M14 domain-containing protein n=1 Tax=Acanthopleuribacter pedis TaxID=442870 RepID=A0A8J7QL03_9BACT|nr:M14 family metallopeptidase [Acanthopleuribacter pedis]MBO1320183.1 hypothetical protein [Acanthopleuribacter pedis]